MKPKERKMLVGDIWRDDPEDYDSDEEIFLVTHTKGRNMYGLILNSVRKSDIGRVIWITDDGRSGASWKLIARGNNV